jgi:transcription termination factor 2
MSLSLFEHQNIALPVLRRMEREGKGGILADHCGLGKTITMATHLMQNKITTLSDLIVCPMSLLEQWKREIKRVNKGVNKKPKILLFHGPTRVKKLTSKKWDYIITTYSIIGSGQLNRSKWGRVVLDESHVIRNGLSSNRPKSAKAAYIIGTHSKYNWCMSATPFCNRMKDIAAQCKFVGTSPYNDPRWWKKEGKDMDNVREWKDKYVLRRTKDNILPPPIYNNTDIEPTKSEVYLVDKYRQDAKKKFESWKKAKGVNKIKIQGEIMKLIQKLRIISNSYYCGESNIDTEQIMKENSKVNIMVEMLDEKLWEDPTKSVVIFSQFTSFLSILEQVIKVNMVGVEVMKFNGSMTKQERDNIVLEFTMSHHPRVLLVSLLAGGVGLNLTPCSTVFLSEPYYNPFLEKQAEERVHRIGQENQVNIYRFSINNSVETWINGLKQKKLFEATGLDLLSNHDETPSAFSMNDLEALFKDHVSFHKDIDKDIDKDKSKKKSKDKSKKKSKDKSKKKSNEINLCEESSECVIGIECSICLDDCGSRKSYNLACGHLFHVDCLDKWKNINKTCPLCKRTIKIL